MHLRFQRRVFIKGTRPQDLAGIERNRAVDIDRLNLRLLQLSSETDLLRLGLDRKAQCSRIDIGEFGIAQVAGVQIKTATQVGQGTVRLHFYTNKTAGRRRDAEVVEEFS